MKIFTILKILLPRNVISSISFLYGLTFKQNSYASDGEDLFIAKYFKYHNIVDGIYLDIGAFHPTWLSKTHLLHKMGWSGYAVDISYEKLRWFRLLRGGSCKTIEAIVSEKKKKFTKVYTFSNNILISELDTDNLYLAKKHGERIKKNYKTRVVKNIFIKDLLESIGKVNFLNLSVPISCEILYHIDFSKYAPDVIIFGINKRKIGGKLFKYDKKLNNFLTSKNYTKYFMSLGCICYVKSKI